MASKDVELVINLEELTKKVRAAAAEQIESLLADKYDEGWREGYAAGNADGEKAGFTRPYVKKDRVDESLMCLCKHPQSDHFGEGRCRCGCPEFRKDHAK